MILSDNETKIDLLNNMAIAKTIVSIIKDSKESVSIGVHGDWGAGKSSVLVMVEDILNPSDEDEDIPDWNEEDECEWIDDSGDEGDKPCENIATVRFNSWQYQGFEDAKIALMSAIATKLENQAKSYYKKHKIKGGLKKLKGIAKNLWKNIDKLAIAKKAAKAGLALATGTAPLLLVSDAIEKGKGLLADVEKAESIVGTAGEALKKAVPSEENSTYKEMQEFRKNFKDLFKEANISKLVVIIDDLDRCLPEVAIDTLETIRLFMFMDETAFVIGADELMIRYAVKKHFPDVEREPGVNIGSNFADKYLEKLIQIPFRIPALGSVEFRNSTIGIIAVGTTPLAYKKELRFVENVNSIKVGLGLHPQLVKECPDDIRTFLREMNEAKYIGEIGLDFNTGYVESKDQQVVAFRKIAKACAEEGGKVLSIHSVKSATTVIEELEIAGTFKTCICILHWFTGTAKDRQRAIENGAYFSINPKMLRTKSGKDNVIVIPSEKILLETDAPFTKKFFSVVELENELRILVDGIVAARGENIRGQIEENCDRVWRF